MISDATFDGLVAGFYRAACDEIAWGEALGGVRRAFSSFDVDMHAIDVSRGELVFSFADTVAPPECLLDYVRTYHRIDPRAGHALAGGRARGAALLPPRKS